MSENNIAIIRESQLISGNIKVSGYKHATVLILCAAIYAKEINFKINNIPYIEDSIVLANIINTLGGNAKFLEKNILILNTFNIDKYSIPEDLSKLIHGAIYLIPALLARFGYVEIGQCGGCQIGENTILGKRPIEHMLTVLEKFGFSFLKENNKIIGKKIKKFNSVFLDIMDFSDLPEILTGSRVSGATKTAILAAMAVKDGEVVIKTPYLKADVIELLEFMKMVGYSINYDSHRIIIKQQHIFPGTVTYNVCADISEIITYITIACYHKIAITIENIETDKIKFYLAAEFKFLKKMGIFCQFDKNCMIIKAPDTITAIEIEVTSLSIYSDHQPFFALLSFNANTSSTIMEKVWHARFDYAKELKKLGFICDISANILTIEPSYPFQSNQTLYARDLRSAAILLIAALKAPGISHIEGLSHLKRGYENLIENLKKLNAHISFSTVNSRVTEI